MKTYRTAEAAAIIGIHPNTVRFYEKWGLITRPQREENGYRIFTELQIQQMRLVRTAFKTEVLQNGLRQKILEAVRAAAGCDFDGALRLTGEYISGIRRERSNAEEAAEAVRCILTGENAEHGIHDRKNLKAGIPAGEGEKGGIPEYEGPEKSLCLKRKEAAEYLGITIDALRSWEANGLLTCKRKQNGYRVYMYEDIRKIKIIRALRCANYSLESILRLMRRISEDPDTDIKEALSSPEKNEDIISVCDRLMISLDEAERNADTIMKMLREMKQRFPAV